MRHVMGSSLALAFAAMLLSGCGDGTNRQEVIGTVFLKGVPLDAGHISFEPLDKGVTTSAGAPITEGEYQIPRARGLAPGRYRVYISAADPKHKAPLGETPGDSGPLAKSRIPAKYSQGGESVDVSADKPNRFDFKIP